MKRFYYNGGRCYITALFNTSEDPECWYHAKVRENNLKTNVKDRFNKERILKCDPDARLGIIVTFAQSKKQISYFWGYRNHVITDAKEELPVWEITKPANVQDSVMFIPLFDLMQN